MSRICLFFVVIAVLLGRSDEAGGCGKPEGWRSAAKEKCVSHDEDLRGGVPGRGSELKGREPVALSFVALVRYLLREDDGGMLPWFEQWLSSGQPFGSCEFAVWSLGFMVSSGFRPMMSNLDGECSWWVSRRCLNPLSSFPSYFLNMVVFSLCSSNGNGIRPV